MQTPPSPLNEGEYFYQLYVILAQAGISQSSEFLFLRRVGDLLLFLETESYIEEIQ